MQKTVYSVAALTPALVLAGGLHQSAQAYNPTARNVGLEQLHAELQQAVCRNDWDSALHIINPMIGAPGIETDYRQALVAYRARLQQWRAVNSSISPVPGCGREINYSSAGMSSTNQASAQVQPQDVSVQALYVSLRNAVCQNDWDSALQSIRPMIGSPNISPSYRQQLVALRHQLEDWRAAQAAFDSPTCNGAIATSPEQLNPVSWAGAM